MHLIPLQNRQWASTPFDGVERCWLWQNGTNGGTSFLRLRAGARVPHHKHAGWEQALVLEGAIRIGETMLHPGDYLFEEAGAVHDAEALAPTVLLVCSEKGVESF
jgi:quercetin dioxygenase-like cupin family protein